VLTEAQRARQRRKRAKRLARQAVPLLPQVPSLLERLQEFYPVAFARVPVPLAIGIDKQIIAAALDDCPADVLHHALHHWTRSDLYLAILAAGGARYGLDGTPQGEVSEADRTAASTDLAARKAKQEAEHKARMMRVA
jgi:ProP effector